MTTIIIMAKETPQRRRILATRSYSEHPSFIAALNQTHADATTTTTASSNIITTQLLQNVNVTLLSCNLGNPTASQQQQLTRALTGADVVVHFSAVNPYPNATWDDCSQSLDHIYYIFTLAVQCSVRRVIFASSNHVMGGYKDDNDQMMYGRPASLYPYTEPRVGTMPSNTNDIGTSGDGKAYAAAKLAGERYARTLGICMELLQHLLFYVWDGVNRVRISPQH